MYDYPNGPVACDDDIECTRLVRDWADTGPLIVYVFWAVCILILLGWWLYRRRWVKDREGVLVSIEQTQWKSMTDYGSRFSCNLPHPTMIRSYDQDLERQGLTDEANGPAPGTLTVEGYVESVPGEMALASIVGISLMFVGIFFVIVVDAFFGCEFTSVDTQCLYGSYPFFGNDRGNKVYFFVLWWMEFVWFLPIFWFRDELRNWCRLPVPLAQAELVHVTKTLKADIVVPNPCSILRWFMDFRQSYLPERVSKLEATVPVHHGPQGTCVIEFECTRYLIECDKLTSPMQPVLRCSECHSSVERGLSTEQSEFRQAQLGQNVIWFEETCLLELVRREVLTGYYLYQLLMYQCWIWFGYIFIGGACFITVIVSSVMNVQQAVKKEKRMARLCAFEKYKMEVTVRRSGKWETVNSMNLVTGDIIQVEADWMAPADLAVLQGSAVCDESGLTGEATPVGKSALPVSMEVFDPNKHSSCMIYGGTKVLQTKASSRSTDSLVLVDSEDKQEVASAVAVVVSTGIYTCKGQLISSMLCPNPTTFKYDEEFPLYFLILMWYAIWVCVLAVLFVDTDAANGTHWVSTWAYGILTTSHVLNPMLPNALEVGDSMASYRLKENRVYCADPKRIAIAGKIRVFCFDKTGTLTREGLDFLGIQEVAAVEPGQAVVMAPPINNVDAGEGEEPTSVIDDCQQHMRHLLSTCHNLKHLGDKMVGEQVDLKMYENVRKSRQKAELLYGTGGVRQDRRKLTLDNGTELEIVRTFDFDHTRMTMSVVVRQTDTGECFVYCKGAPEWIVVLCSAASCPEDFKDIYTGHSANGCYVLGAAMRQLGTLADQELYALSRDEVEDKLELLGLLRYRNEIKPETADAIKDLKEGDVRCIMLTGDNAECGVYIAKQSGMVDNDQIIIFGRADDGLVQWTAAGDVDATEYIRKIELISRDPSEDAGDLFQHVELAINQEALDVLIASGEIDNLILHIRIFGRLRPDGKVAVIERLSNKQLVIGMCGDGGNDCGALQAAHAGIALSDAEASIVSPFTSSDKSLRSVVVLLREGRAALATNFALFKFLVTYGQLFSVLKLMDWALALVMCKMSYYMTDIVGVIGVTSVMTTARPSDKLSKTRPPSSLFGYTMLSSVIGAQVIHVCFLFGAMAYVKDDPDYVEWPGTRIDGEHFGETWDLADNWEMDVIYFGIFMPWVSSAVTFSYGHDWRQPVYKNYYIMTAWLTLMAFHTYLLFSSNNLLTESFHVASIEFGGWDNRVWAGAEETCPPMRVTTRIKLWSIFVSSCICATLWEKVMVIGPGKKLLKTPKHDRPEYVHLRT